ncbi:MAG: ATP-binding protein, partial [Gemmatimonadota bacterium]
EVPRLILQPLVENAIRHGLSVRQGPGRVVVTAERRGERLILRVEDDGVGLRQAQRSGGNRREGIGLRNASERLHQLYGANHHFELRQADEGGVTVELDIPFREGEAVAPAPAGETAAGPTIVAPEFDDPATWRTGEYSTLFPQLADSDLVEHTVVSDPGDAIAPQWQVSGSFRPPRRAVPPPHEGVKSAASLQPAPALGLRAWMVIGALWLALAIFWTNQMALYQAAARSDGAFSWLQVARLQVATSVIWLALSPIVLALARRYRMDAGNWMRRLPLHAVFAMATGVVHTGVMRWSGLTELPVLSPTNMNPLTGDFFVYFGLLAWSHARDFVSWYRTRELEGARLTARIAGSRFQALRVQLRPQFLLATLDLLAELVHRDVPRAERLITRLADTLRLTLELARDATTTLKQELDLLLACVETHRIGIRPGVQLVTSAATATLALRIPSRLLCTMADDLLAADTLNPGEPLTVRVEVERVSDVTRVRLWGEATWGGRSGGSHAWWRAKSVAEAAVADAGSLVSVTFPDRATAVLLIADPPTSANRPEPAGLSAAVA